MNIHHLEIFYYVAKFEGFTAAAKGMPYGIQQPAISGQVIKLEDHLGVRLIDRRPFKLTPKGKLLYDKIRSFFDGIADIEKEILAP